MEFLGNSVFFNLWVAGVIFFTVNVGIISTCLKHHHYVSVFNNDGTFNNINNVIKDRTNGDNTFKNK